MNLAQVTFAHQAEKNPEYVNEMHRFCYQLVGSRMFNVDGTTSIIIGVRRINNCVFLVKE